VQWCERDPSAADDRKLTFVYYPMAEATVINASEIRLELSGADRIYDELKVLAAPKRVTRGRPPGQGTGQALAMGRMSMTHANVTAQS
jgi:hypothetical protein